MSIANNALAKYETVDLFDFLNQDDVLNRIAFIMLLDSIINNSLNRTSDVISIQNPYDEEDIIYYTNTKFLEIIDEHGLNGFIY